MATTEPTSMYTRIVPKTFSSWGPRPEMNGANPTLRGAISLASLLRETGRGAEGRALLSEVFSRFEQGFDSADLQAARALLDESP